MKLTSFLSAAALSVLLAVCAPQPAAQAQTTTHPSFFDGEVAVGNNFYYLEFPDGAPLGYYTYFSDPSYIYHVDAGYFYVVGTDDGSKGVYLYDFKSSSYFYTSPSFPFPYLYSFKFGTTAYYFPDSSNPGHYSTNPRYFYLFGPNGTGTVIAD